MGDKVARRKSRSKSSSRHKRPPRKNPRTGRPTWYLGHRVPDTKHAGLDNPREVRGIVREILEDYQKGRIPYRTAMSRLNILTLIVKKDRDFRGKREAYRIIERGREELKALRVAKEDRA